MILDETGSYSDIGEVLEKGLLDCGTWSHLSYKE